jgi:hypothetical protein
MQPEQYAGKGLEHIFMYDHDFRSSHNQRKPEFYEYFTKAYDNYIEGDWLNTYHNLSVAQSHYQNDGPTKWMTEYLEKYKNMPPEDWAGHRNID